MTPPDTNLHRQKKRHRGPLIGIALVVLFGLVIIFYWIGEEAFFAPGPDTAAEDPAAATQAPVPTADTVDETLQPGDPEVEVGPRDEDPTND